MTVIPGSGFRQGQIFGCHGVQPTCDDWRGTRPAGVHERRRDLASRQMRHRTHPAAIAGCRRRWTSGRSIPRSPRLWLSRTGPPGVARQSLRSRDDLTPGSPFETGEVFQRAER